jgi:molybdate transport system substrate-binding protein
MSPSLSLISSMATKGVLADLTAQFTRDTGIDVAVTAIGGVDATKRVQAGEVFDLIVLASNTIAQLIEQGHVRPGTHTDLVNSGVSVAVKTGAARPDLSTSAAVQQAVLAADKVGYSTGPSGVELIKLFERWGIAEGLREQGRLMQAPPGVPVARLVAQGDVSLGFQQLSELIHAPGITVVAPLPDDIQINTVFSAGISTGSQQAELAAQLLAFMASAQAEGAKRANGMTPV